MQRLKKIIKKTNFGNFLRKIMLAGICPFFCSIVADAQTNTASKTINVSITNATLKDLFSVIEKASSFRFFYDASDINVNTPITAHYTQTIIDRILKEKLSDFSYEIKGNQIIVKSKVKTMQLSPQSKHITGMVTDENSEPIAGAMIVVKGTTRGVSSDLDGTFTIQAAPEDQLEVSFLGYQMLTIPVGKQTYINVALKPLTNELDEVTIVAFGKQKKSSVVSSIESVNMKDLKIASANFTTAFAGKIPGLISYQTTGEPGADNAQFFVRGVTTFGYKQSPLILIDGFEATANDLARTQPDDIESFSILKDASATALYGARGANGIILVNTKAGTESKVKVSARVDVNMATPTRMNKLVDGVTYMNLYNEARYTRRAYTGVKGDFYDPQKILFTQQGKNPMLYPNIDWYDMLFNKQTYNTKANINVSGGGNVATYYVAGGYDKETGLLKVDHRNNFNNNIDINRFHIRSNVIFKLGKTTSLDTRITGRFERYNGPYTSASSIFGMVMNGNPVDYPAVWEPDAANIYTTHTLFGAMAGAPGNPYAKMVNGYENRDETTMSAQATLMQDLDWLVRGMRLQLKGSASVWNYYSARRHYNPYYYALLSSNPANGDYTLYCTNPGNSSALLGNVEPARNSNGHYYFEAHLNWERNFGKHSINAMTVGMLEEFVLTSGSSTSIFETLPERNLGISGRVAYDYDNRYFLEFNFGYNGSEKFAPKHRFGFFPSVGGGWLISNEPYYGEELKKMLSLIKLKLTYGLVGNDAIAGRADRFFYLSNVGISTADRYGWGKLLDVKYDGIYFSRYANPDVTWEVSRKLNAGLEIGLFKDETVKFQVDVFRDIRDRIYMTRSSLPYSTGFHNNNYGYATLSGNLGKVKSQGVDASLDMKHSFNSDFWVTGRANFTYSTNEYMKLDEPDYKDRYRSMLGQNINQAYGYVAERLFVDDTEIANSPVQGFGMYMPGDIKYTDVNRDGRVDSNDQIPIGFPTVPEIQYGFGLSSGYRNVDFSFFFQGNARVSFFINPVGIAPFTERRNAMQIVADDYWSETNPNIYAFWPRLSSEPTDNNTLQSTWWLRDGKFLRLKSIELGYAIPFKKWKLNVSRIYLSAENLFVISPFKMWDPEMGSNGLAYPINRRFNVGLQLSF
jgi:TonB-linked SusC/RagA family outer membrane protein